METLKISAKTKASSAAGALAATLREGKEAELQAVGVGAVNQMVKAAAIARGFVAPQGMDLTVVPGFVETEEDGKTRTAIKFAIRIK